MSRLDEQGGGPVATALVTLQRLGRATCFLGVVAADSYHDRIHASLQNEGVDLALVQADATGSNQLAFIGVDQAARRTIFWHRGNKRGYRVTPEAETAIATASLLLLDGLDLPAALEAATIARREGVPTLLDAGTWRPEVVELLPLIDHLLVSEAFVSAASGEDESEARLDWLKQFGAEVVGFTCGRHGCWARQERGRTVFQPAFSVAAVDSTGCGDVFHGAYAHALLQGLPLARRLVFAAATAALKTRSLGGRQSIPTLAEVETFLAANP